MHTNIGFFQFAYCQWPEVFPGETCVVLPLKTFNSFVEASNRHFCDNSKMSHELVQLREQCKILSDQMILDLDRDEEIEAKNAAMKKLLNENIELSLQVAAKDAMLLEIGSSEEDCRSLITLECEKMKRFYSSEFFRLKKQFNTRLGNVESAFSKLKEKHSFVCKERSLLEEKVKALEESCKDNQEEMQFSTDSAKVVHKALADRLVQTQDTLNKVAEENRRYQEQIRVLVVQLAAREAGNSNEHLEKLREYIVHTLLIFTELCKMTQEGYKISADSLKKICATGPKIVNDARVFVGHDVSTYGDMAAMLEDAQKAFVKSKWVGETFSVSMEAEYEKNGIDLFREGPAIFREGPEKSDDCMDKERLTIMCMQFFGILCNIKTKKMKTVDDHAFCTFGHMLPLLFSTAEKFADKNEEWIEMFLHVKVAFYATPWRKYESATYVQKLCAANAKSSLDKLMLRTMEEK